MRLRGTGADRRTARATSSSLHGLGRSVHPCPSPGTGGDPVGCSASLDADGEATAASGTPVAVSDAAEGWLVTTFSIAATTAAAASFSAEATVRRSSLSTVLSAARSPSFTADASGGPAPTPGSWPEAMSPGTTAPSLEVLAAGVGDGLVALHPSSWGGLQCSAPDSAAAMPSPVEGGPAGGNGGTGDGGDAPPAPWASGGGAGCPPVSPAAWSVAEGFTSPPAACRALSCAGAAGASPPSDAGDALGASFPAAAAECMRDCMLCSCSDW